MMMAAPTKKTFPLMLSAARIAALIPEEDIRAVLDFLSRRDALGPIVDPTQYRAEMDMARRCGAVARAFQIFARACHEVAAEELA